MDLRGSIPSFIHISDSKVADVNVLDILPLDAGAFFVTRAKSNFNARHVYSAQVDKTTGVVCDQSVALNGFKSAKNYPEHLRGVRFKRFTRR